MIGAVCAAYMIVLSGGVVWPPEAPADSCISDSRDCRLVAAAMNMGFVLDNAMTKHRATCVDMGLDKVEPKP
jgi:hypothetical protein